MASKLKSRTVLLTAMIAVLAALALLGGCATGAATPPDEHEAPKTSRVESSTSEATTTSTSSSTTTSPPAPQPVLGRPAPAWLGTRIVPLDDDLNGISQPTPDELIDRQFHTRDLLPPPSDDQFHATVTSIPDDVVERSTWNPDCPVTLDELSYVTVSFYGFDGLFHTGELIVNAAWAEEVIQIFERLHADRYPIERMQVVTVAMDDSLATGDGNNTSSFTCRTSVGDRAWSMHAFGLAVDINPFHNPYKKGDLVLPELATAYTDRTQNLTGMLFQESAAVEEFEDIGWTWGGNWRTLKDWMHFSSNGR